MSVTLEHPEGRVTVEELGGGRRRIQVALFDRSLFVPHTTWDTSYPLDLIGTMVKVHGPRGICDEIMRDEEPTYLQTNLRFGLLGFVRESEFAGKRILDFGMGSGASSMVLRRMFPSAEIVGVELEKDRAAVAKARAAYYGFKDVRFLMSPGPSQLPSGIGPFDFAVMSGVYEHLLPAERLSVLPQLWSLLTPCGVLFINETPNRAYPMEGHTTGLPLLNYVPDRLAYLIAQRYSRQWECEGQPWEALLRGGIRGATVGEVLGIIRSHSVNRLELLGPIAPEFRDYLDHYCATLRARGAPAWKTRIALAVGVCMRFAHMTGPAVAPWLLPHLTLALSKGSSA